MSDNLKILIIGAGLIGQEYIKVVNALGHTALVIGRGTKKVKEVKSAFPDTEVVSGGLQEWLEKNKPPQHAIIATPIENLAGTTRELLMAGCSNILVEKPLTYSIEEASELSELASSKQARVVIAFNRRSYMSVEKARELIEADGGVSSFHFDFSEATFRIDPKNYSEETTRFWGIANSSHVIDTAFYLCGKPRWMESRQYGEAIEWHPAGSIFTGMGETEKGIPFTYHANWGCPGKWNIEIMTPERKLLFSPMERLHQQVKGSFKVELVDLDYSDDIDFKPGFRRQVQAWLQQEEHLLTVGELIEELKHYQKIFTYH